MKECGKTRTSKTGRTRKRKKKQPEYFMIEWFREQIESLSNGKDKTDWRKWLKDPKNGLY